MVPLGIGERLRSARQALGLSLEEIESATRIRRSYLDALEREAFTDLPGPTYARGFIRSYADYLGLPPDELLDAYPQAHALRMVARKESPVEVRITPGTRFSRTRRLLTGAGIALGLGVLIVGYVLFSQIRQFAQTSPSAGPRAVPRASAGAGPSEHRAPVKAAPTAPQATPDQRAGPASPAAPPPGARGPASPAAPAPTGPAAAPATTGGPPPAAPPQPAAHPPVQPPAPPAPPRPVPAPGTPVPVSPPAPAPALAPAAPGAPSGTPAAGQQAGAGSRLASPLQVAVLATDRSWVRTVADGTTVFEGFVNPGDRQVWAAKRELTIRVGNASALGISVNGHDLGRLGGAGQVVERTFQVGGAMPP